MKNLLIATILGVSTLAFAQTAPKTPVPTPHAVPDIPPPALSVTEEAVRTLIGQKSQELNQLYAQYVSDLARAHPGWHVNPSNPLSTTLVKDAPAPEVKK